MLTTAKFCFYCDSHRADLVFFVAFVYLFRVDGADPIWDVTYLSRLRAV